MSVVIPAFNAEAFIAQSILSVLNQTYEAIELTVVNDGSVDGTGEIASSFSSPHLRVVNQPNLGVAAARNRGMAESSGSLVAFLDADDHWDPEKIERQVEVMTQYDCAAIGCLMRYESSGGRVLGISGQDVTRDDQTAIQRGQLMPFPLSSILFDRQALEKVGGFDEVLSANIPGLVEDLDLLARVASEGPVLSLSMCLGAYVVHDQSATASHLKSQRMGTRYVRERLRERAQGGDLSWEEFVENYQPSLAQRYGDAVQMFYRHSGQHIAEGRRLAAVAAGAVALILGPRYTLRRLRQQRSHRKGEGRSNRKHNSLMD